ncbi:hypothetical protein [Leifsonia sp. LS-T14]|uniref:hypothetical protein n=1 Tax=unclassified Leifsonia TaxID=2663824 RepID=UPI0035A6EE11
MTLDDDGQILVAASAVRSFARPSGAEVRFAYDRGLLRDADVVSLMLTLYEAKLQLSPEEEELALLLSDDLGRVRTLVDRIVIEEALLSDYRRVWLYILIRLAVSQIESDADNDAEDALFAVVRFFDYEPELIALLPAPYGAFDQGDPLLSSERSLWVQTETAWYQNRLASQRERPAT